MKTIYHYLLALILLLTVSQSCKKQDEWLNAKTQKSDVAPETVADYQSLLDNTTIMNDLNFITVGLSASDNIYVREEDYSSMGEEAANLYTWAKVPWLAGNSSHWNGAFKATEFANICIEGLGKINTPNDMQYANVLGQSYFHRAVSSYNLMNVFCKAYDKNTAENDLGLPLRTTSDVNIIIRTRESLKETYEFAINDLKSAISLLPDKQVFFQRPNKNAARGYLAKIYLNMGEYELAYSEVNEIPKTQNSLIDFNGTIINYNSTYRFPANGVGNPEIIFYSVGSNNIAIVPDPNTIGIIPPELYDQYNPNDLRKKAFYIIRNGNPRQIGSYTGRFWGFAGLGTNEIFLIRAECEARLNKAQEALNDINLLLKNRYTTGTFVNYTLNNTPDVLRLVLTERRKELPFTANIRGEDLRRLNKDPNFQTIIKRIVNGKEITIQPNDPRYVFPIPDNEIQVSGIPQNN